MNQQKKLFNDLGPEELQVYLKNAYNYKDPHAKTKSDFKQGHAWECMMGKLDRIYNTNYDDPRHPVNRNLYKDQNGRVKYDITKKRGAGYNARGFDAYFDDYYKEKYLADKNALIHCLDDVYREERHGEKANVARIQRAEKNAHRQRDQDGECESSRKIKRQVCGNLDSNLDIYRHILPEGHGHLADSQVEKFFPNAGHGKNDYNSLDPVTTHVLEDVRYENTGLTNEQIHLRGGPIKLKRALFMTQDHGMPDGCGDHSLPEFKSAKKLGGSDNFMERESMVVGGGQKHGIGYDRPEFDDKWKQWYLDQQKNSGPHPNQWTGNYMETSPSKGIVKSERLNVGDSQRYHLSHYGPAQKY